MVTDQQIQRPDEMSRLLAAIQAGLESLTTTGPSIVLNSLYKEALEAVTRRPTQKERETALTEAWLASSRAVQSLQAGNPPEAARAMDEMYSKLRRAVSASRPS